MRLTLLEAIRGLLERTYHIRTGIVDLGSFVIGDLGYRELYGSCRGELDVGSALTHSARTLVRETGDGVAVCVYFPDSLIRRLEAFPPQRGLGQENLDAFATFVEEIDHLLVIAERSLGRRPVSLLELELHANVSKYLVLARFLAGPGTGLDPAKRLWLRGRLFEEMRFCATDRAVRRRYREAARWACRLLDALSSLGPADSVELLRCFHSSNLGDKLHLISRLAA